MRVRLSDVQAPVVIAVSVASLGLSACTAPIYIMVLNGSEQTLNPLGVITPNIRPGERRRVNVSAYDLRVGLGKCEATFDRWTVLRHWQRSEGEVTVQVEDDLSVYVVPRDTLVPLGNEALAAIPATMRITPSQKVCR